MLGIFSFSVVR